MMSPTRKVLVKELLTYAGLAAGGLLTFAVIIFCGDTLQKAYSGVYDWRGKAVGTVLVALIAVVLTTAWMVVMRGGLG